MIYILLIMSILISQARIVTQDRQKRIFEGSVLVEGNNIAEVSKKQISQEAEWKIDGKDKLLLPGLINLHTHLPMGLLRGYGDDLPLDQWLAECIWPVERRLNPRIIRIGSKLGLVELIASGTTCFADMYFFEDEIAKVTQSIGLRAYLGFSLMDQGTPELEAKEQFPKLEQFIEGWKQSNLVKPVVAPHSCYTCSPEILARAAEVAKKHEVLLHTHCCETRKEVYECQARYGKRPIELFKQCGLLNSKTILAHCCWLTKAEIKEIARAKASIAHNPVSNMKLATGSASPLTEILKAKISVGLGTDGAASNNTLDLFETMKLASLLQKHSRWDPTALPAQQVLDLATLGGAKSLGMIDKLGSIEEGKLADLIVIDLKQPHLKPFHNPLSTLVYAAKGSDVCTTIVNGKLLMYEHKFMTCDYEEALEEANQAALEFIGKI
jgi:5-methylthioadenosine/S-adenosylhomocysteine deaminase